jgi:glycosyltransferase involved in cell wall biosynthesis
VGLLFVTPTIDSASEAWMRRMIDELAEHISIIAARHADVRQAHGRIPIKTYRGRPGPLCRRILAKILFCSHRPRSWIRPVDRMRQLVGGDEIDRILVQYLTTAIEFDSLWPQCPQPLFVHCHGFDVTWDHRSHDQPDRPVHPPGYRERVLRLAEHATIIANSRFTADRLREAGVPDSKIAVKYIGVPVPEEPICRPLRSSPVRILFLGRLIDCKGPEMTIEAFDRACCAGLDGQLIMAGDGPLMSACHEARRRARCGDRIEILGAVDWATGQQLRSDVDIFTAHSCYGRRSRQVESFGAAFVEASARGLPVVTGRSGALDEVMVDGETAILFEPGDIDAHAEALLTLARDPARRAAMGQAGWQRARDHYSVEIEKAQFLRILGLADNPEIASPSHVEQAA